MAGSQVWYSLTDYLVIRSNEPNGTDTVIKRALTKNQFIIVHYFLAYINIIVSFFGIGANIVNLFVFFNAKKKDSLDICLLVLSMADFLFSICNTLHGLSAWLFAYEVANGMTFRLDPKVIIYIPEQISTIVYTESCLIVSYMAAARCACVMMPLRYKDIFTMKTTVFFLILFAAVACGFQLPRSVTTYVVSQFMESLNATRLYSKGARNIDLQEALSYMMIHTTIPFATQFFLAICACIMIYGLRRAAKFRQNISAQGTDKEAAAQAKGKEAAGKHSRKDVQAIQQILMITILYLCCNTPKLMRGCLGLFFPEIQGTAHKTGLKTLIRNFSPMRRFFEAINCSVNIFLYLRYNRKYREVMLQLKCFRNNKTLIKLQKQT